ncbi:CsgG/HfaB family protein [Alphaproteobacteria bacterium]|nr:CsgG/HfaB family protein [Alphaproteobacteria bacterium]MDC3270201.1 CsgG/HfaB family protein [Alphaproteobacteria bacterium]
MKYIIAIFFIFCITSKSAFTNTIEYIDVKAKGVGASYTEALNNSLSNAIAQVNGRSIETKTSLKKISQSISTNKDSSYYSSKEFQKIIKELTQGYVSNFRVLNEDISSNNVVTISVSAKIGKYKLKKSAQRKRIAVMPFYYFDKSFNLMNELVSNRKVDDLLIQNLISYLVQTRKFTVLDREYINHMNSELSIIKTNQTNIEETVKLGQKLFSDYIMVGTLQKLYTEEKTIKIKNSNNYVSSNKAFIEFSYRIIDVPTSQIMFSDDYKGMFDIKQKDIVSIEGYIIKRASLEIGSTILNAIYPLRLEKISGGTAYIGQGGLEIAMGDEFTIIELGGKIKDSYTNEYIGREQKEVGKIQITQVSSKLSSGKIVEQSYNLEDNFEPKKYILRKIDTNKSDIDIAKEKINKKNKKETVDDDW